ncbi:hypothetical protein AB0M47_08640 [Hamadaea sp. NPDC051192]|uniref:hypothetical protein n=1 Tax=Hamadaea sp. NPDC051192 TaxID=3154940 RepID=UPI00343E3F3F
MGVTYDYFRAADVATASAAMAAMLAGGRPLPDVVETKLEYGLWLTTIVGLPTMDDSPLTSPPEVWVEDDDPDGSFVVELHDVIRDSLANAAESVSVLAQRWVELEAPPTSTGIAMADVSSTVRALVELAGRAQAAGERMYCWCCP